MRRGTTPLHTFTLPIAASSIAKLRVTYAQQGNIVAEKTEADATLEDNIVQVTLTQEETLKFRDTRDVEIQLKVLTTGGDALVSEIWRVDAKKCLNNEVLV